MNELTDAQKIARIPVLTVADAATLNMEEVAEGYADGQKATDFPSLARSRSYWHGWKSGRSKVTGIVDDAQVALANDFARRKGIVRA